MAPPLASIDGVFALLSRSWLPVVTAVTLGHLFMVAEHLTKGHMYLLGIAMSPSIIYTLQILNNRLAFGPRRTIEWKDEVVVITGGSSGLGKVLARKYCARDTKVAVLDVTPYETSTNKDPAVCWYKCDVGDRDAVERAGQSIIQHLGTPTILINNAGIVNGKDILSLSIHEIERNLRVNMLAHFHSIQIFLPGILSRREGGTIVTVASILGRLGAARLSDYSASKAGLIAMHSSLTAELSQMSIDKHPGAGNVKTVLVTPGQLSSPLFRSMPTPNSFFGPIVAVEDLANDIVKAIDSGQSGVIATPLYARWVEYLSALPYSVQRLARFASGIDRAMLRFGTVEG